MALGKKPSKPANARPSDEDEDETISPASAETSAASSGDDEDEVETVTPAVAAKPAAPAKPDEAAGEIPQASAEEVNARTKDKNTLVVVTMLETIEPAPRVGSYDVRERLGKPSLEAKKSYRLPHFVAIVLADAGKAALINA